MAYSQEKPRLTVAVASNFYYPLTQILNNQRFDFDVRLVTASSGVLYAQALNGAPFDIFLSADKKRPESLSAKNLSTAPWRYALGKLVLYPSKPNESIDTIITNAKRIAIANETSAPYGLAAAQVLGSVLVNRAKIVQGNNVAQAFQFADSGNADVAFVAESMVIQAYKQSQNAKYLTFQSVNSTLHTPIEQFGVVLQKSKLKKEAAIFKDFLLSCTSQIQLNKLGYQTDLSQITHKEGC
ncbi:molybdate ABC transporter substrate-binding protein [Glaciecola sp. 1036]|uniref:molybdate ABC transporter substrate-binding protein n=1 Tax=Alteromonadaceae TaxID=72275 RepID=UPI003D074501